MARCSRDEIHSREFSRPFITQRSSVAKLLLDSSASLNNSSEKNISGWLSLIENNFSPRLRLITVKRLIKKRGEKKWDRIEHRDSSRNREKNRAILARVRLDIGSWFQFTHSSRHFRLSRLVHSSVTIGLNPCEYDSCTSLHQCVYRANFIIE